MGTLSSLSLDARNDHYTTQFTKFLPPFVHFVLTRTPDGLAAVGQFNLANDYRSLSLFFVTGSYVYRDAVLEDWARRGSGKQHLGAYQEQQQRITNIGFSGLRPYLT